MSDNAAIGSIGVLVAESRRRTLTLARAKTRVLSIFGAGSREDEVYISRVPEEDSGGSVVDFELRALGFEVERISPSSPDLISAISLADLVFINAHGDLGECGRIQGICDVLRTPYTGSGVLGSAVGLQKNVLSGLAASAGLQVPNQAYVRSAQSSLDWNPGLIPGVLKPARGGSSVGVTALKSRRELEQASRERQAWPAVVEKYIEGKDVTLGILIFDGKPEFLPWLTVDHLGALYDEEVKMSGHWNGEVGYSAHDSLPFSGTHTSSASELAAISAISGLCDSLNLRGALRFDFRLAEDGKLYLLELNTNPGLSRQGNISLAARASGIEFRDLISFFVASAAYDDPITGEQVSVT